MNLSALRNAFKKILNKIFGYIMVLELTYFESLGYSKIYIYLSYRRIEIITSQNRQ